MTAHDISVPLPILTPRLLIRPPQGGDGAALHAAKVESRDALLPWMPWARDESTPEASEAYVAACERKFDILEDMTLHAFEREGGRLVVSTGLHRISWPARTFEIGYWTRSGAAGRGYASEATNALLRYAFNALAATRVTIAHDDGNEGSRRVIEKCGFRSLGTERILGDPAREKALTHWYVRHDLSGLPPLDVRWTP